MQLYFEVFVFLERGKAANRSIREAIDSFTEIKSLEEEARLKAALRLFDQGIFYDPQHDSSGMSFNLKSVVDPDLAFRLRLYGPFSPILQAPEKWSEISAFGDTGHVLNVLKSVSRFGFNLMGSEKQFNETSKYIFLNLNGEVPGDSWVSILKARDGTAVSPADVRRLAIKQIRDIIDLIGPHYAFVTTRHELEAISQEIDEFSGRLKFPIFPPLEINKYIWNNIGFGNSLIDEIGRGKLNHIPAKNVIETPAMNVWVEPTDSIFCVEETGLVDWGKRNAQIEIASTYFQLGKPYTYF
jgi:hypothetical protein